MKEKEARKLKRQDILDDILEGKKYSTRTVYFYDLLSQVYSHGYGVDPQAVNKRLEEKGWKVVKLKLKDPLGERTEERWLLPER